jgi:hypothetical protein
MFVIHRFNFYINERGDVQRKCLPTKALREAYRSCIDILFTVRTQTDVRLVSAIDHSLKRPSTWCVYSSWRFSFFLISHVAVSPIVTHRGNVVNGDADRINCSLYDCLYDDSYCECGSTPLPIDPCCSFMCNPCLPNFSIKPPFNFNINTLNFTNLFFPWRR